MRSHESQPPCVKCPEPFTKGQKQTGLPEVTCPSGEENQHLSHIYYWDTLTVYLALTKLHSHLPYTNPLM